MAQQKTSGSFGTAPDRPVLGTFGSPREGARPTQATTPDTAAAPPPTGAEGFTLSPAVAIAIGTAASGLIQGIMAQRNAAKNREFQSQQNEISREESRRARHQQAVQGAIGNIGNRAAQGAAGQGSALSGLASLFGGL